MIVKDGTEEDFFVIEEHVEQISPVDDINGELVPYKSDCYPDLSVWSISSDKVVRVEFNNHASEEDQAYHTWCRTGIRGFTCLSSAIITLNKLLLLNNTGAFDWEDGQGRLHRRVRYGFRISQLKYSISLKPVCPDRIVMAACVMTHKQTPKKRKRRSNSPHLK